MCLANYIFVQSLLKRTHVTRLSCSSLSLNSAMTIEVEVESFFTDEIELKGCGLSADLGLVPLSRT